MTKFRIRMTAAFVGLAVSSCVVSPESEDENTGVDVAAFCSSLDGCGCPPAPPPLPPLPPLPPPLPPPCPDADWDGLCDYEYVDFCPGTVNDYPLRGLAANHFALLDDDDIFDTIHPGGSPKRIFTLYDTGGCSCEQILYELGGRYGQYRNGCSYGTMLNWVRIVNGYRGRP